MVKKKLSADIDLETYIARLKERLSTDSESKKQRLQSIVDTPFIDPLAATSLDLGIVELLLVNKKTAMIDRVALSDTAPAKAAVRMSAKPLLDIKIPLDHPDNIIAKAIKSHESKFTEDWKDLFTPVLSPSQASFIQAGAGLDCSRVCPLNIPSGGALAYSYYQPYANITENHIKFMTAYTNRVSWYLDSSSDRT